MKASRAFTPISGLAASDRDSALFLFLLTYHQHIRNLRGLCLTDLVANLLRALVKLGTDTGLIQRLLYLLCVTIYLSEIGSTRT